MSDGGRLHDDIWTELYRLERDENLYATSVWFVDCPGMYNRFVYFARNVSVRMTNNTLMVGGLYFHRFGREPLSHVLSGKSPGIWAIMDNGESRLLLKREDQQGVS